MNISGTLQRSLERAHSQFEMLEHAHTEDSLASAREAGIPAGRMAKSVILDDGRGHYLMAVLPASRHLDLSKVRYGTEDWQLASEHTVADLFSDCVRGAVPPLGEAYGMSMVIDPELTRLEDIYFESGDHESLVHMKIYQFLKLVPRAEVKALCH